MQILCERLYQPDVVTVNLLNTLFHVDESAEINRDAPVKCLAIADDLEDCRSQSPL